MLTMAFAANCVPATTCKEDVVGMTKGLVATYGVVLQILQQNLGSLYWLGEGKAADCYQAMNQINMGQPEDMLKTKPDLVILGHVVNYKTVLEVPGMKKLGAADSLKSCKDDPTTHYLFVHKNLYWSGGKDALDLGSFSDYKKAESPKMSDSLKGFGEVPDFGRASATGPSRKEEREGKAESGGGSSKEGLFRVAAVTAARMPRDATHSRLKSDQSGQMLPLFQSCMTNSAELRLA